MGNLLSGNVLFSRIQLGETIEVIVDLYILSINDHMESSIDVI